MAHGEAERRANSETKSRERTTFRGEYESRRETESLRKSSTQRESASRAVLSQLAGTRCPLCDGGTLVRERYKENRAVVCDQCDVPRVQVWDRE